MLLRNSKGEELFGAGRGILMCELSVGERTKLMSALPKKSRFIKDCIRAHWARGITQDCSVKDGLAAEPLWHTPRFKILCNWKVRHYFVNVLNVTQISDIIDYDTDRPFTAQRTAVEGMDRDISQGRLRGEHHRGGTRRKYNSNNRGS